MPNAREHFVGIDISKDWFDVAVLGKKRTRQFANTKKGIRDLVRWMIQVQPQLIVVEATGGYEEALVLALFESSLPVALISPQRVRQYARAKGRLAKTDQLDAHLLAEYGQAIQRGRAAARYANQLADVYRGLAGYLAEGRAALVINHGGVLELGVVACLPDADHASWGPHFDPCEGVRLFWEDGKFVDAEILRVSI